MNLIWIADNNENKFMPVDSSKLEWVEKINNQTMFFFSFVKYYEKENGLLLHDETRDLHVFIHNSQLKTGHALDDLKLLYTGKWLNLDDNKSMIDHFKQAEIVQRNLLLDSQFGNIEEEKKVVSTAYENQNSKLLEKELEDFMVDVLEKARFDPDEEYLTIFSDSPLLSDNDADSETENDSEDLDQEEIDSNYHSDFALKDLEKSYLTKKIKN